MALGPFLQNLADQVGLTDTDDSNLIHRLMGEEGYRWTALALLYEIAAGGGGGGGGAVTIADGADVALGATTDAAATAGGAGTVEAKLRLMTTQLASLLTNTPAGVQRTLTSTVATTGGTVALGAKSVSFTFSADYAGSVNGATIDPSVTGSKSFSAPGQDTLPAIVYTCTAGSVTVDVMT